MTFLNFSVLELSFGLEMSLVLFRTVTLFRKVPCFVWKFSLFFRKVTCFVWKCQLFCLEISLVLFGTVTIYGDSSKLNKVTVRQKRTCKSVSSGAIFIMTIITIITIMTIRFERILPMCSMIYFFYCWFFSILLPYIMNLFPTPGLLPHRTSEEFRLEEEFIHNWVKLKNIDNQQQKKNI